LNFQQERYESTRKVVFKNPKGEVLERLRESGPVPGEENGAKGAGAGAAKSDAKKKRPTTKNVSASFALYECEAILSGRQLIWLYQVDMEKLADGLQKLSEDDLLNVVQLIHDHKTTDTYTKNDVESM